MDGTVMVLENEQVLVARAAGDPGAFAAVYDHYFKPLYNYVRYRVQDAKAAEDITSQVFERALARIGGYRPERGEFAGWLFTIARNAVSDHLRSARRRRWLPLDLVGSLASDEPPPDEVSVRHETWDRVLKAVARLEDRERELIGLKFGARLTNRQIADLTGLTESNVSVILYRAVRRLRAQLAEGE